MPQSTKIDDGSGQQTLFDAGRSRCIGPSKFWCVQETPQGFVLEPIPNRANVAATMGAVITLSSFASVYFLELPWLIAILGLAGGGAATFVMHKLMRGEIDRGPYVTFDAKRDELAFPRYSIQIPKSACRKVILRMWPHRTADGPRTAGELIFSIDHEEHRGCYMTVITQRQSDARALANEIADRLNMELFEIPYACDPQPALA